MRLSDLKNYKRFIPLSITLVVIALVVFVSQFPQPQIEISPQIEVGGTTLKVPNGGTGASSFSAGQCLVGNGTAAIGTQACGGGQTFPTSGMINLKGIINIKGRLNIK